MAFSVVSYSRPAEEGLRVRRAAHPNHTSCSLIQTPTSPTPGQCLNPGAVLPGRIVSYVLEVAALAFGILTLVGLIGIVVRRCTNTKVRRVTTITDWYEQVRLLPRSPSGC